MTRSPDPSLAVMAAHPSPPFRATRSGAGLRWLWLITEPPSPNGLGGGEKGEPNRLRCLIRIDGGMPRFVQLKTRCNEKPSFRPSFDGPPSA